MGFIGFNRGLIGFIGQGFGLGVRGLESSRFQGRDEGL